jgi:hypothetical protein
MNNPRFILLLALTAITAFGLVTAVPATASGSGYLFAKWLVTLTFPNDQPLVELTTEIWYKPVNQPAYLVTSETEPLTCAVSGNLVVSNEIATFDGQSYITCTQPDMAQKIADVSQGNLLVSSPVPVGDVWARGQVFVDGGAPPNTPLPVHHHPDIQYDLAQTGGGSAVQYLRVDGVQAASPPFAQAFPFNLGARFRSKAEACNGWLPYDTRFGVNGTFASGTPAVISQVLWLDLDETDIYFGYSPLSNTYFQGHIKTLIVDPGACGRGLG